MLQVSHFCGLIALEIVWPKWLSKKTRIGHHGHGIPTLNNLPRHLSGKFEISYLLKIVQYGHKLPIPTFYASVLYIWVYTCVCIHQLAVGISSKQYFSRIFFQGCNVPVQMTQT